MIRIGFLSVLSIIMFLPETFYANNVEIDSALYTSNLVIIDKQLDTIANDIVAQLISKNCDTVYIKLKSNKTDKYLLNKILTTDKSAALTFFSTSNDSLTPVLDFDCFVNTQYLNGSRNSNEIQRHITIQISAVLKHKNNQLSMINNEEFVHKDKITRTQGVLFNKSDYDFARCDLPAEPESFWKEIVQPIAFIGSAALTVFLLFTLRSR